MRGLVPWTVVALACALAAPAATLGQAPAYPDWPYYDAVDVGMGADGTLRIADRDDTPDVVLVRWDARFPGELMVTTTERITLTGDRCRLINSSTSFCPPPARTDIDLAGGDDQLTATLDDIGPVTVRDGAGNDRVTVRTNQALTVTDGPGNDVDDVGGAPARIVAGPGADRFATAGADATLDYSAYTLPVHVDFNGAADDGAQGEGDYVAPGAFSELIGGAAGDAITAPGRARTIEGGPGDDVLVGEALGTASTVLDGGPGNDVLSGARFERGGDGDDRLTGGEHSGDLDGGAGDDVLAGGARDDVLHGGPGADRLSGGATGTDTATYAERTTPVAVARRRGRRRRARRARRHRG